MGTIANDRRGALRSNSLALPPVETALSAFHRINCVALMRAQLAERRLNSLPQATNHGSWHWKGL